MASTTFQDYNQNNPIVSSWLNDVNKTTYTAAGTAKIAVQSAAAWLRFSVIGGVVTIQQSNNIATVVRTGVGVYVVTYAAPMTNAVNSYGLSMNEAGFLIPSAESSTGVTLTATDHTNAAVDPPSVSLQVFGAD